MAADGLTVALEDYQRAQDELVEARNRLARAIAGAAMSGMTRDEIVEATGYDSAQILRIWLPLPSSGPQIEGAGQRFRHDSWLLFS
jgi:hypothetical protein